MTTQHDAGLFRDEAIKSRQAKTHGAIIAVRPCSFKWLTTAAVACLIVLLLFAYFESYTRRNTVRGELLPISGLIEVFADHAGIVEKKFVNEGQRVQKGDVLYVLSAERHIGLSLGVQGRISAEVQKRKDSLEEELHKTLSLNEREQNALAIQISGLESELAALDRQILSQGKRAQLSLDGLARYSKLQSQGFISQQQLEQKQEEALEQEKQLRSLERERMAVSRLLQSGKNDMQSQVLKHHNLIAQLEREITKIGQELTESEAKRKSVIVAPQSGVASAVFGEPGQAIDLARPLLSIVPDGAQLIARIYAPSKVIGFVQIGGAVVIRYSAFPYEKFGHARGRIESVSLVAVSPDQVKLHGVPVGTGEPLYIITASIEKQHVDANGRTYPLRTGMTMEVDLLQETRRIYEWVLKPFYSISGRL